MASKRELSKEQGCIVTAPDRSKHSMESVTGTGPVSGTWPTKQLGPIIASDSVVVSDGLASYQQLVRHKKLNHVIVQNKGEKREHGAYHLQHVDAYHSRLKQWINGHFHGVATKYLPHYLGWQHEIENKHIQNWIDLFQAAIHQIPQLRAT